MIQRIWKVLRDEKYVFIPLCGGFKTVFGAL